MKTTLFALVFGAGLATAQTPARVAVAMDFGPVPVGPGQSLRLCANNLYQENSVRIRFLIVDAVTGRPVVHQDSSLAKGQGTCFVYDVAAGVAGTAPTAGGSATRTLIGLLIPADPQLNWTSPFSIGVSSAQVVETGTARTAGFLPAVQRFNVVLPAVQ